MLTSKVVPILVLASACAVAQTFEVASVKSVQLMDLRGRFRTLDGGPGTKTPTRITGHATLMMLITSAYGVKGRQVSGPSWLETEFYEIAATLPPATTKEQEKAMWQSLLKERFHLEAHRETRDVPTYALVVGRNGPKLKASDPAEEAADKEMAAVAASQPRPKVTMGPDGFPQIPPDAKMPGSFTLSLSSGEFLRIKMFYRHKTTTELADALGSYAGRLVEDQTGLTGKFDFTLAFETEPRQPSPAPDGAPAIPAERGASLSNAVQEQLGLKLESKKSSIEMLIISRVERTPTEN